MDSPSDLIPIRFLGFAGGMDYTSDDGMLDQNTLRVIKNAIFKRRGALSHPGGNGPSIVTSGTPYDFCHFYRLPDSNISSIVDRWANVNNSGGSTVFSVYNPSGGANTTLATLGSNGPFDNCVIQVAGRVIATSRDNLPAVWYGLGGTALTLGYPEPNANAVQFTYSAGFGTPGSSLDTTGLDPYLYTASFVDKWGNETNPIPVFSDPATPINQWIVVKVPVAALPSPLISSDIARVHVWRIGGNNSTLRLSNDFVPTVSSGFFVAQDGVSDIDKTPDSALPDVFANYSNIAPPKGLLVLVEHIGRIFGFGESSSQSVMQELASPARLWFSRPFQYNSWGNTDDGIDDDGGFLDIDDNHYDKLLGATSTGSVLVLGRLSSVYTLFGNGFQTFRFDRRADHGLASRRSICRHVNVARYVASDFYPYELGNADSVRIGRSVERYIDTLSDASRTICFSHDGRFFACIPQASLGQAKTFVLDDRNGAWVLMDEFDLNAAYSLEPPTGGKPQLMGASRAGFIDTYMNQSSSNLSRALELRTDKIRVSHLGEKFYCKSIFLEGDFTGGPLTVTITVEGTVKTYTVLAGSGRLLYIDELPLSLTGEWVEVAITGNWSSGEFRRLEIIAVPSRLTSVV